MYTLNIKSIFDKLLVELKTEKATKHFQVGDTAHFKIYKGNEKRSGM